MPSHAELAHYKDSNPAFARWLDAVTVCYFSTAHVEVQAAVDQTPNLLVSTRITYAALLGLGYGDKNVRDIVTAKMVEQRLDS